MYFAGNKNAKFETSAHDARETKEPRRSLTPGDIVLVVDATASRGSWMMGKVLDVRPDSKGLVHFVQTVSEAPYHASLHCISKD